MPGAVIILVVMVLVGPVAVMLAGAIWSALMGHLLADDADTRTGLATASAEAAEG